MELIRENSYTVEIEYLELLALWRFIGNTTKKQREELCGLDSFENEALQKIFVTTNNILEGR